MDVSVHDPARAFGVGTDPSFHDPSSYLLNLRFPKPGIALKSPPPWQGSGKLFCAGVWVVGEGKKKRREPGSRPALLCVGSGRRDDIEIAATGSREQERFEGSGRLRGLSRRHRFEGSARLRGLSRRHRFEGSARLRGLSRRHRFEGLARLRGLSRRHRRTRDTQRGDRGRHMLRHCHGGQAVCTTLALTPRRRLYDDHDVNGQLANRPTVPMWACRCQCGVLYQGA